MEEKDLKQIKEVVTEAIKGLPTKSDLTEAVEAGNENLAQIINTAFQEQKDHLDEKFEAIDQRFVAVDEQIKEVNDTLHVIEAKVNKALNIEYVRLEKRLKVVEQKLGIKPVSAEA